MDNDLVLAFRESLKDFKISRSEKNDLMELLRENPLSEKRLMVLRSKIFGMAKSSLDEHNGIQIIDWLNRATKLLDNRNALSNQDYIKAFFSPGGECRSAINSCLKSAKHSIDICVFTITDNDIVEEILSAKKRGVNIRIISDNDKSEDLGSDITRLKSAHIPLRLDKTDKHMHHKFMLVDKSTLLTGSYNWTRSAANANEENIILLTNQSLCHKFQKEFDHLWNKFK